jgi:hypothetical protein
VQITVTVNGEQFTRDVEPRLLLVHFLRDDLRLTGTHWGCDTSNCGACVVRLDGVPVKSCTVLAVMADGAAVDTVEGLAQGNDLDPVQAGFMTCHGLRSRPLPGRDPRGHLRPGLPLHRLREHRALRAVGGRAHRGRGRRRHPRRP